MKYILSTVVASAALAAAHGFVDSAVIGGETYEFYQPYTDPYTTPAPDRVSRYIAGNGPVLDVTSNDMTCGGFGEGSKPAALHAPAAAGSTVQLSWTLWPDSHVGPVITYMARCPDAGCQDYQPGTDAVWFKIQEGGREGVTNNWAASKLMTAGGVAEYTIPECLSPGFYLVRHEIIALHQGAEYYPGCHQLEVTGSGSTVPTGLVSFPGAYSASDAGIDYSPYQQTEEYTIPGPKLFTCGGGSAPAPAPTTAAGSAPTAVATSAVASSAAATAAPAPSSTPAPTTPIEEEEEPVEDDCPVDDEEPVDEEPVEEEPVDEDDCPAEDEEDSEGGLDPVAVDDEDDCPAEDDEEPIEEPVEEPVDEDDCPAEDDEEPIEEPVDDEDDCPAEDEEPVEEEEPVAGDDDEYEEIDECEETVPTKRQTLHERRLNY